MGSKVVRLVSRRCGGAHHEYAATGCHHFVLDLTGPFHEQDELIARFVREVKPRIGGIGSSKTCAPPTFGKGALLADESRLSFLQKGADTFFAISHLKGFCLANRLCKGSRVRIPIPVF